MAFSIGESVYVPRFRVGLDPSHLSSFYWGQIVDVEPRRLKVDLPGGSTSDWIASSFAKKKIKAAVITLGDFGSENLVFDPLAKSVTHHLRLLLAPDEALSVKVRSVAELRKFWETEQAEISHVVLVGHGNGSSVLFGVDGWISGSDLASTLRVWGAPKKHFLSLCCESGRSGFAKSFSQAAICGDLVAPFQSVHAAAAAQFYSNYFNNSYLGGKTSKVAFNAAQDAVLPGTSFRFWDNGEMS
jgi:hypothetical protein